MIERKTVPARGGYNISMASEQMRDGRWSAVGTLQQATPSGVRNIDLPVTDARFDTEAEAERHIVDLAERWIDTNAPADAAS